MNLPNKLTVARLVMVPVFVLFMSIEHVAAYGVAYLVFTVASITDYFDGKIAREQNLITNFGKLMDPLADKVLMAAGFIMAMQLPTLYIPGWTIVAILAREFLVTGARSISTPNGEVIAASAWGKLKTVVQMVYIFLFLLLAIGAYAIQQWLPEYVETYATALHWSSFIGIIGVALLTVYTGIQFAQANWKTLNLSSQQ